ncbi:hypothetical protein [Chengkuizengella axinellae]|uniref:Uncharacterized protein n=1 Tax=Chengkuizengella axinellae TaxID=3064388 RepID=A0ABT9IZW3_9BACL|nr:hypothetical protein [Chengkuizengella sp. 2205SS18-9]MDP5274906.1 hypothetical protein [Chengkuizengella sp. 2205SS18-9]
MNFRKVLIISSLFILIFLAFVAWDSFLSIDSDNTPQFRTEIQPIVDRFPRLDNVEKTYWIADTIEERDFGPTSYWMKGYVYLENHSVESITTLYEWEEVHTFNPSFISKYEQIYETGWFFSEEFNSYIKSSNYIGNFYFDMNNDVLYFEVEK